MHNFKYPLAGLVPATHVFLATKHWHSKTWMPGTNPGKGIWGLRHIIEASGAKPDSSGFRRERQIPVSFGDPVWFIPGRTTNRCR
jgi:hypothetical protein